MGRVPEIAKGGVHREEATKTVADCEATQMRQVPPSPGAACSTEQLPCCQGCEITVPHRCDASAELMRTNTSSHEKSRALRGKPKASEVAVVRKTEHRQADELGQLGSAGLMLQESAICNVRSPPPRGGLRHLMLNSTPCCPDARKLSELPNRIDTRSVLGRNQDATMGTYQLPKPP